MKHFTQFIQLFRAAWDGDKSTCVEQVSTLATRLESEGDTAHARMLRFTLASLQDRELSAAVVARHAATSAATADDGEVATASAAKLPPLPGTAGAGERVELTFGRWEQEAAPPR